jgi:hypothetical protein
MTLPLWCQLMKDSLRTIESETRAAAQHELIDPAQAPRIYALVEVLRDTITEIGEAGRAGQRAVGASAASEREVSCPPSSVTRVLR